MENGEVKVAVLGTGYWGKNLVRVFNELNVLEGIYDASADHAKSIQALFSIKHIFNDIEQIADSSAVKAVVIATPAVTHFDLVKKFLLAGKDVFVEKPLALNVEEAQELTQIAESNQRVLMIDHLLQYHPAVIKLKELIDEGKLGKLLYVYSNRLNIGKLRAEENILWSFAPHDISVILSLTNKKNPKVEAFGEAYLQEKIYDTTVTNLTFEDKLKAHVYVSWLHPYKEQKFVVIGNYGMAVFNDVLPCNEKLTLFHHKIDWVHQTPVAHKSAQENIVIEDKEPLKEACLHFIDCIKNRRTPRTDGREAIEVLSVLQKAQEDLDKRG
jgi:UDP-2-acetamido-3-amino-2,3-dideoxy-glucuronate N-acetyltransferase